MHLSSEEFGAYCLILIATWRNNGEHEMPGSWVVHHWKAAGGYANQSDENNGNSERERIWFSPACLPVDQQLSLLDWQPAIPPREAAE